jgi:hypothetical protein
MVERGNVGIWSENARVTPCFVPLAPLQMSLLLQFTVGDYTAEEAATAAGIAYDEDLLGLIAAFEAHGVLTEAEPPPSTTWHRFHHPQIPDMEVPFIVQPDALASSQIAELISEFCKNELMGQNVLSESFTGSAGFGIRMHARASRTLARLLPGAGMILTRLMEQSPARLIDPQPNAFYINVLAMPDGGGARLHRDCTLDGSRNADWVSVAYLRCAPRPRGRLFMKMARWPVGFVDPSPGMIVHFRGDLAHGVTDTLSGDGLRLSFVCEQYCLPPESLARCPFFELVPGKALGS